MSYQPLPRFRGNALLKGKHWTWELNITIGNAEPIELGSTQLFISRDAALKDLRAAVIDLSETAAKAAGLPPPTEFMDLNANEMKSVETFKNEKS